MREDFQWWVLPMVNPDGVIIGNFRCNLQGKDMNRRFFADDDETTLSDVCSEVELIKAYMRENLAGNLRMFLDLHDHSKKKSICLWAPKPADKYEIARTKVFSLILDDMTDVFRLEYCRYINEKTSKNSARMYIFQNYKLPDSYTIESSGFGFETKNEDSNQIVQFTPEHFLEFGKTLALATARHLDINLPKNSEQISGVDIELDFGLSPRHSLPGDHSSWMHVAEQVKLRKF